MKILWFDGGDLLPTSAVEVWGYGLEGGFNGLSFRRDGWAGGVWQGRLGSAVIQQKEM